MRWFSLIFVAVAAACAEDETTDWEAHDQAHALNWLCEEMAQDYRKDRSAHSELCEGYDEDGWPIEGAEIKLPVKRSQ